MASADGPQAFAELQTYYPFDEKFGRPAKSSDKGKVEGLVGYKPTSLDGTIAGGRRL